MIIMFFLFSSSSGYSSIRHTHGPSDGMGGRSKDKPPLITNIKEIPKRTCTMSTTSTTSRSNSTRRSIESCVVDKLLSPTLNRASSWPAMQPDAQLLCGVRRESQSTADPPCRTRWESQPAADPPCRIRRESQPTADPPCRIRRESQPTADPPCRIRWESQPTADPPCRIRRESQPTADPPCRIRRESQPTARQRDGKELKERVAVKRKANLDIENVTAKVQKCYMNSFVKSGCTPQSSGDAPQQQRDAPSSHTPRLVGHALSNIELQPKCRPQSNRNKNCAEPRALVNPVIQSNRNRITTTEPTKTVPITTKSTTTEPAWAPLSHNMPDVSVARTAENIVTTHCSENGMDVSDCATLTPSSLPSPLSTVTLNITFDEHQQQHSLDSDLALERDLAPESTGTVDEQTTGNQPTMKEKDRNQPTMKEKYRNQSTMKEEDQSQSTMKEKDQNQSTMKEEDQSPSTTKEEARNWSTMTEKDKCQPTMEQVTGCQPITSPSVRDQSAEVVTPMTDIPPVREVKVDDGTIIAEATTCKVKQQSIHQPEPTGREPSTVENNKRYLQWVNKDALCWLDVLLCVFVHSRTIRRYCESMNAPSLIKNVITTYDDAMLKFRSHHLSAPDVIAKTGGGEIQIQRTLDKLQRERTLSAVKKERDQQETSEGVVTDNRMLGDITNCVHDVERTKQLCEELKSETKTGNHGRYENDI